MVFPHRFTLTMDGFSITCKRGENGECSDAACPRRVRLAPGPLNPDPRKQSRYIHQSSCWLQVRAYGDAAPPYQNARSQNVFCVMVFLYQGNGN